MGDAQERWCPSLSPSHLASSFSPAPIVGSPPTPRHLISRISVNNANQLELQQGSSLKALHLSHFPISVSAVATTRIAGDRAPLACHGSQSAQESRPSNHLCPLQLGPEEYSEHTATHLSKYFYFYWAGVSVSQHQPCNG